MNISHSTTSVSHAVILEYGILMLCIMFWVYITKDSLLEFELPVFTVPNVIGHSFNTYGGMIYSDSCM